MKFGVRVGVVARLMPIILEFFLLVISVWDN